MKRYIKSSTHYGLVTSVLNYLTNYGWEDYQLEELSDHFAECGVDDSSDSYDVFEALVSSVGPESGLSYDEAMKWAKQVMDNM